MLQFFVAIQMAKFGLVMVPLLVKLMQPFKANHVDNKFL